MLLPRPFQCKHTWTRQSLCCEMPQYIRHPSVSVCKLSGSQTVGPSITTVDHTLISRGISSYSRSRTNKLSPNIGFAWQWGSLWTCVYVKGGACIHQTETVGQYWGMENQHAFFKGEAYAQTSQCQLPGLSISRGPDRHFSFVALAGKTAYK